jgi:hypothetical protein
VSRKDSELGRGGSRHRLAPNCVGKHLQHILEETTDGKSIQVGADLEAAPPLPGVVFLDQYELARREVERQCNPVRHVAHADIAEMDPAVDELRLAPSQALVFSAPAALPYDASQLLQHTCQVVRQLRSGIRFLDGRLYPRTSLFIHTCNFAAVC